MPDRHYVYSTMSQDVAYSFYKNNDNDLPERLREETVVVKGGAHVKPHRDLVTPKGMRTEVTEAQLERLKNCEVFKKHMENGFITVRTDKVDPEVAAGSDMEISDDGRQLTRNDYPDEKEKGKAQPSDKKPIKSVAERVRSMVDHRNEAKE